MTDERVTKLSDMVVKAVEGSRVVALEVADVAPAAMAEAITKSPELMMFDGGQRLVFVRSAHRA